MHVRITFVIVCLATMGSIGGCEEKSNTSTGGVGAVSGKSLHQAALDGDLPSLKKLLDNGGLINQEDSDGYTPLHWACWGKHSDAVKELLERGASVRQKQDESTLSVPSWARIHTPLALAIYKKDADCCRLLLGAGANPNGEPMQLAAYLGQDQVLGELIGAGPLRDADDPPLIVLAGAGGHSQTVARLLSLGVDIDRRARSHSQLDDILTPTSYRERPQAAPKAPEHTFEWDLNLPYLNGQTSLEVSAENGHDEVVKLLLERGANKHPPDIAGRDQTAKPNSYGMTRQPPLAMFLAAQAGRTSTVRLLTAARYCQELWMRA